MKVIFNYATRQFEPMEPSMRERFSLGSKDPAPEIKTDGEVAGALMDAFPQQSFLQYQNAVDDGFQGTFEEFLQINSLDKSELDMQAIEGQVASSALLKNLLKPSDDVAEQITKTKTSKRGPEFNILKKKDPENYTEAEKLFEQNLTEKFQAIANDPLYKDLIPKKFKNIKSITELSASDFKKIEKDFVDFQFKPITDEKGLGPYSTLKGGQQSSIRTLFKAREDAKKRPDFFSLDIAGDTFNFPYMKGVDPKTVKNFEKIYPVFKKIQSNPNLKNYYKQIGKLDRGEKILINDIQAYLTGVDTRSKSVFESSKQIQFLKSLDLENKLSEETIELLKTQKGQTAANIFKQAKATKESAKVNLAKVNTESIQRINEIYSADPDATAKEVIDQYYGNSIKNKSKEEQAQMLKELRNDVITYYKIGAKTRKSVKGVRLPSKEKVDDILTSIMEGKGKDSFDIYGGYLRNIYSDIADSVTKPGFRYDKKVNALSKQFPGQHVDHTVGLSAVHEAAPGYVEAVQIISKNVNQKKGRLLDRAATGIIDDFFTNTPNKLRKIGDKEYKTFEEKVDAFNTISKQFADANGVDAPLLRFGEPGKGPSPKETVEYFPEFSEGAQKNMMEVWNNHGFVVYTKSRPMQSSYWKTLKDDIVSKRQIKNMGGLISRVNFSDGTKIDEFLAANKPNSMEEKATLNQAIAALQSPELKNQFLYDTSSVGKLEKNVLGEDGDRTLMQQFNTQFLDPRSYPYYAQKLARGFANIPEFILSTPKAGLVFIRDLKKNMGITKESVAEIMDILDPEITRDFLNGEYGDLLGISDKAIQASEEKRSGPQRTTGEFLQFVGELPGPATPFFLLGYAPKLLKQLKSVGVTAAGIDKVNKEIENKVAQQGVDQTRRDIVLSIGAGAGVGFLKYLGLDFLSKAPKAVAKQVPEIVTKGGTPKYFFDFVNLIKSKGDDITDKAATVERQKVYDYNGYTMYEDMTTGKISINKDTEGGASYYVGDGEYDTVDGIIRKEEIVYDPPETILDDAGKPKKVPDYYEESTMKPDYDGGDGDVEGGLDSIDDILDLLAKSGEKYNLKELNEMGINPEGLGRDFLRKILRNTEEIKLLDSEKAFKDTINKVKYKIEKAGGGIIKLAGDDSGPPPKSGPTPHGLPYIAKNVRPIKERK
jgi:hypothetical protein